MSARNAGFALLGLAIVFGLAPLVAGSEEVSTATHHLLHAGMLAIAAVAGIFCAGSARSSGAKGVAWLVVALVAPVVAMLLMWPSEYTYFETHRYGHVLEHLGIIACGFVTGFGGQRFAAGIGWAAAISVVAMALLGVWGYGVGPAVATSATPSTVAQTSSWVPPADGTSGAARGAEIFKQNCAMCHGSAGQGGAGPSLQNENQRKNLRAAEAWIEHPSPPMPQLYPSPLSARDVADVAAYVETLR